jgi:hypothetical protein
MDNAFYRVFVRIKPKQWIRSNIRLYCYYESLASDQNPRKTIKNIRAELNSVSVSLASQDLKKCVEPSWDVMEQGDARERRWRGNWRLEWVAITLHTTSEHGVSSITTDDAYTSAASSRLNLRPRRFKWTRPFRRKTKYGFCACAITFRLFTTVGHCSLLHQIGTQDLNYAPWWLWETSSRKWHRDHS